jgi:hypothetical protein
MDGVKQQDSTPQNDSTLGFKWMEESWHHFKIKNDRLQIMFKHKLV